MYSFKKSTLLGLSVSAILALGTVSFAQDANPPASPPTAPAATDSGGGHHFWGKGKHRHHKKGFFLGMCVGQALAQATPPILVPDPSWATMTKDQRKAARQADKPAIKAAKEKCKAEFKAMRAAAKANGGSNPTTNGSGGSN